MVPSPGSSVVLVLLPSHCPLSLEVSLISDDGQVTLTVPDANIRESNKPKSPAFSFGLKLKPPGPPVSPSPNAYNTSGLTVKGEEESSHSLLKYCVGRERLCPRLQPYIFLLYKNS